VLLAALVTQIAIAGGGKPDGTITISRAELKQLIHQEVARSATANAAKKKKAKSIPGPQGPQGVAGAQGAAGPQGAGGPQGAAPACAGNGSGDTMVAAGAVCIDKYEVSVWSSPTGGTQYGVGGTDDYPVACTDTGQGCKAGTAGAIYALSVPGVRPSANITYFQAQQALANVGKRLPSNAEWQQAVAGTPDPGPDNGTTDCRTTGGSSVNTGSRSACVSNFGANDMVGNVSEWVADWVPTSTGCPGWGTFSTDSNCFSGASTVSNGPGALIRGGSFIDGTGAGPFAVFGNHVPYDLSATIGFRGAR
jgi:sulfatase-modifying factor enzyme 1